MNNINVSPSRIKQLETCSYSFYLKEILKMPETTHPKALVGTCCHSIFEFLRLPRRRKYYDLIKKEKTIYCVPSLRIYVDKFALKHNIAADLIFDIDNMVQIGLFGINFLHEGATKILEPERTFNIKLKNGNIKGVVDSSAIYGEEALIIDYKSQKTPFTKLELSENIQAAVYQLNMMEDFGLLAKVQFIMLRHPPTKRLPQKHIQEVPARSKEELAGLKIYLDFLAERFQTFDEKDAEVNFAADDPKKSYFCQYICQLKKPMKYKVIIDKDGNRKRGYFINDDVKLEAGETIENKSHNGCLRFYTKDGQPRNFG